MTINQFPIFRRFAWVGLAAAILWSVPFASAQDDDKQQHQLSDKASEALQKLKPLQDAKNYQGMMTIVDSVLGQVDANSYDAAYLLDVKARLFIGMEKYDAAVQPWEEALRLSDQNKFFDEKQSQDIRKFVAQLLFSEAINSKDKAIQQRDVAASAQYLKAYLSHTTQPEPDTQMLYAQILYYRATADEKHIDQNALKEARTIVEQGLQTAIHPRESFYLLLLTILQQQNDYAKAAQLMELVLTQNPNRKDVWPTLFGTYYNLANTAKEGSDEQRDYYIRAILTIERAQKFGFMNTPRDNYNLFTLYVAAGEPSIGTDLLYKGLKSGKIESNEANWRTLGIYYQQVNRDLDAINALKEAASIFPRDGNFEVLIGQIYQQEDKTKDARDHFAEAVARGNLGDKPHLAYLYLAYAEFELGNYEKALSIIDETYKMSDGAKDPQVKTLKDGIEQTIQDRNARLEAAKRKQHQ